MLMFVQRESWDYDLVLQKHCEMIMRANDARLVQQVQQYQSQTPHGGQGFWLFRLWNPILRLLRERNMEKHYESYRIDL